MTILVLGYLLFTQLSEMHWEVAHYFFLNGCYERLLSLLFVFLCSSPLVSLAGSQPLLELGPYPYSQRTWVQFDPIGKQGCWLRWDNQEQRAPFLWKTLFFHFWKTWHQSYKMFCDYFPHFSKMEVMVQRGQTPCPGSHS